MPRRRTIEPIGPTTIPGEPMDPKIPPELRDELDEEHEAGEESHEAGKESEEEQQARESEKAFDRASTRIPPD
jgi:hypothetical protein